MEQTAAHANHNPDLLACMPKVASIVEVGCSTGALAKAYQSQNPGAHDVGIEVDESYGEGARQWFSSVLIGDEKELLFRLHDKRIYSPSSTSLATACSICAIPGLHWQRASAPRTRRNDLRLHS